MLALTLFLNFGVASPESSSRISHRLPELQLPVGKHRFEPNMGRYTAEVQYVAFAGDGVALFTPESVVDSHGVSMMLRGAHDSSYAALDFLYTARNSVELDGPIFIPHYASLVRRGVYPGIDVAYQIGSAGDLEVHFFLQPEAKLSDIALVYGGVEKLELTKDGEIQLKTITGTVMQRCPKIHRMMGERFVNAPASLRLDGDGTVRVAVRAAGMGD